MGSCGDGGQSIRGFHYWGWKKVKQRFRAVSLLSFLSLVVVLMLTSLPQTYAESSETKTVTITRDSVGGLISNTGSNFTIVWTALAGNSGGNWSDYSIVSIGSALDGGIYYVHRIFVKFDTSTIPSDAQVTNATISIESTMGYTASSKLKVESWTAPEVLTLTDYDDFDSEFLDADESPMSVWHTSEHVHGLKLKSSSLILGGASAFCLRLESEVNAEPPTGVGEPWEFQFFSADEGLLKLIVTYFEAGTAAGGVPPTEDSWVPINLPNIPAYARRILEWVQQMIREHEELRALAGLGLIMVVGGVVAKWDKKNKRKLRF